MRVLLEIHEGQIVRNLLENGLLDRLQSSGADVLLVNPAVRVPAFTTAYPVEMYDLGLLDGAGLSRWENYEFALGQLLSQRGHHVLRRWLWRFAEPQVARRAVRERSLLKAWRPDVVVSTHISQIYGRGLVAAANQMSISTIGNLNSWDNAWKGLKVRPKIVTCWSENNRAELSALASYGAGQVRVIGAPAFDVYSAPNAQWTRAELCKTLGLDPARPILLFATLGQFKQQIDETNPLAALLKAIDAGVLPGSAQVVVRLHPWSREAYFKSLLAHPAVTVSRYEHYIPGLTWTPTRAEAILAGNLLRHADVVISPGSSMVIEAAIFDTPVVVPVFNEYMPQAFENYFRQTWLNQHFGRIHKNDWVYLARDAAQMASAILAALADRGWYRAGRQKICENILGPLDGSATQRFADLILESIKRR